MTIHFHIEYRTAFGEELSLNIIENNEVKAYRMTTIDGIEWWCDLKYSKADTALVYYYKVAVGDSVERSEWQTVKHVLDLTCSAATDYVVYDRWNAMPEDAYLYSSAFTDCINHLEPQPMQPSAYAKTLRLVVRAPQLREGQRLAVVGAQKVLGEWNLDKALPMTLHNYCEWAVDIDASLLHDDSLEFKLVVVNGSGLVMMWECGCNRTITLSPIMNGQTVVYSLDQAFFEIWNRKLAGTLVPVFSLRSKTSAGIGDFGDLKTMIDLMAKTGQRVLQLLPINDTTITHTWTDSYPYSCISIFAIHPQYADLHALPELKDAKKRAEAEKTREELNALPQIDYEKVNDFKINYLRQIFHQEACALRSVFLLARQEWHG